MLKITKQIKCVSCGADVNFMTTDSVVAKCKFCGTVNNLSQSQIQNFGIKSNILPDFSKIQIGTNGSLNNVGFSVVGRMQIKYQYGFWNEWFIVFNNGRTGWLSDIKDEYYLMVENTDINKELIVDLFKIKENNDTFSEISFDYFDLLSNYNKKFNCNGFDLNVIDWSIVEISGVEGEVGFDFNKHQQMKVMDFRTGGWIATVDFTEDKSVFFGISVKEQNINLFNTRTVDLINEDNKAKKNEYSLFACPCCGANNPKIAGVTLIAYCKSCNSKLNITSDIVEVIDKLEKGTHCTTTLKCGAVGKLMEEKYTVLGVIKKGNSDFDWNEYYLMSEKKKFIWLVETEENEWFVVNEIENIKNNGNILEYNKKEYKQEENYTGSVKEVFGSFNWEIEKGSVVYVNDFKSDNNQVLISQEIINDNNHKDVSYSYATKLKPSEIKNAFNVDIESSVDVPDYFKYGLVGFEFLVFLLFSSSIILAALYCVLTYKYYIDLENKFKNKNSLTIIIVVITILTAIAGFALGRGNSSNYSGNGLSSWSSYSSGSHK